MGLDMYLKKYHKDVKVLNCDDVKNDCSICNGCKESEIQWRKANQIHNWFVKNVQNGIDDCGSYDVSVEKLKELRDLCKAVELNPDCAEELLPTVQGFFFGMTTYDEFYFEKIADTKEQLDKLIENHKDIYKYYYSSSW